MAVYLKRASLIKLTLFEFLEYFARNESSTFFLLSIALFKYYLGTLISLLHATLSWQSPLVHKLLVHTQLSRRHTKVGQFYKSLYWVLS